MLRVLRPGVVALALLLFPLVGCETKRVWLELPSFGADGIQGVWLWRWSDQNARYERACRIVFGAVTGGVDPMLPYIQECNDEQAGMNLQTVVEYSAPDTLRIGLWYMRREQPGTYKVTSYGASGESSLSATTLEL